MGVMTCSRNNCENIMCSTYVSSVGYVCYECQSEFKKYLEVNNLSPKTEKEINKELILFMNTPKIEGDDDKEMTVDEFFSKR